MQVTLAAAAGMGADAGPGCGQRGGPVAWGRLVPPSGRGVRRDSGGECAGIQAAEVAELAGLDDEESGDEEVVAGELGAADVVPESELLFAEPDVPDEPDELLLDPRESVR
ncbi:MAG TPA: hypothetical protein VFP72_13315 [Kineosporiaceae bacterium]|nr:hypothetical protein [Kineosporiaceae bacterium]